MRSNLAAILAIALLSPRLSDALAVISSATIDGNNSSSAVVEAGHAIARNTSTGDIYVVGNLSTSATAIFVAKLNSSLVLQSSVSLKGSAANYDEGRGLALDSSGNLYVAGTAANNTTGDDIFLAKLDSSLTLVSSVSISGNASSSQDEGRAVIVDGNSIYLTGRREDNSGTGIFVTKFDTSLVVQTSATIKDFGFGSIGNAIAADSSGNIYVTGYISTASSKQNLILAKFNSSLVLQASSTIDGGILDEGFDLAFNSGGDLFVTGVVGSTSDARNIYLAKLNSSLAVQASTQIAGPGSNQFDEGRGLAFDQSGKVVVAGAYTLAESSGGTNFYIGKFNSSTLAFVEDFNFTSVMGTSWDEFFDLTIDADNFIYATGRISQGDEDIHIAKISDPITTPVLSGSAINTSSIAWTWLMNVSTHTGFNLAQSTSPGTSISGNLATSVTTYAESSLSTNTAYSRVMIALGAVENATSSAKTVYTLAAVPSNLTVTEAFVSSITLTWSDNTNPAATVYRLGYWLAGGSTSTVETTALTYTVTSLGGGNTYYFHIQGKNGDGVYTAATASVSTVTLPAPPTVGAVTPGTAITLIYNPPPGEMQVAIPANNFSVPVTITIVTAASIPAATSPMAQLKATNVALDITPDVANLTSQDDITISMSYRDTDIIGMDEKRLICAKYITAGSYWMPIVNSTPNPANNKVICRTRSFSTFQIMETILSSPFDQTKIYPNPFIPSKGHAQVNFANLPGNTIISVFTLAGEKISEIQATSGGLAAWDSRTTSGEWTASGVYLIYMESGGSKKILKLGIER
ncbi:MAG: SBBP repeat-containing protein [Elusimicrobia bacterium]|nr:SBBP repeat-containing protein [Elusimicrobiota bacterium]